MRFVWQFLAVMVMYAIGGNAVNAVKENDWLTFALGLAWPLSRCSDTGGWCGGPNTGPRRTWHGNGPWPGPAGAS